MKSKLSIVFLIAAIVLIATSIVMLSGKQNGNKKGKDEEENNKITYNAVFELDENNSITSFKKNKTDIVIKINTKATRATFNTTIEDNKIVVTFGEEEVKLEYTEEGLKVSENNVFESGLYKKAKDYIIEEFYSDSFGNIEYVESNLNYVYRNGDNTIYLYEKEADVIRLTCKYKDRLLDLELTKNGDYYSTEIFDKHYRIDIIDKGIKLSLDGDSSTDLNGDYTKDKKLKMDEIVSMFSAG